MSHPRPVPSSPRLRYEELSAERSADFHALAVDPHVRHYLLDGQVVTRAWSDAAVITSTRSFREHGLGLFLVFERSRDWPPIGFGGYWCFEELGPELQLVYALRKAATGKGYATEMASALVCHARVSTGMRDLVATVDAPNVASIRVLEKLGFECRAVEQGAFGNLFRFVLLAGRSPDDPR